MSYKTLVRKLVKSDRRKEWKALKAKHRAALAANDSHGFFAAEGGVFETGPTGTNVMDLALVRVEPQAGGASARGSNTNVSNASKSV